MYHRLKPFLPGIGLAAALVLLLFMLGTSHSSHTTSARYSDSDPAYNKAFWVEELNKKGARDAYAGFRTRNQEAPFARQHFSAHVMGELLAEELGTDGISVCDASFGFGCYHGFFGRLIAERGTDSIRELDAKCVEAFGPLGTGCQHGIGHGILEYVGYDDINAALELCDMTTSAAPLLGCSSGVFMEYHERLGQATEGYMPEGREFNPADPYDPCTVTRTSDLDACYYGLGLWYRAEFGTEYQKIGQLCADLPDHARTHCFLGVGSSIAPLEGYSLPTSLSACATYSSDDALACRAGVSWAFYADPPQRELADDACAYPDQGSQEACLQLADLAGVSMGQ